MINYSVLLCEKYKDRCASKVFDTITMEKDGSIDFDITTLISIEGEKTFNEIIYYFLFKEEKNVSGRRSGKCVGAKNIKEEYDDEKSVNKVSGFPVSDINFDSSGQYVIEVYRYNKISFEKINTKDDYVEILKNGDKVAKYNFNVEIVTKK